MRSAAIIPLLFAGMSFAQDLPMDQYADIMESATPTGPDSGGQATVVPSAYDGDAVADKVAAQATEAPTAAIIARSDATCTYRSYNGPQVTQPADTPQAFLANQEFHNKANAKRDPATYPEGYTLIPGFYDLTSAAKSTSYITYTTRDIFDYDPQICANKCNAMSNCVSFNICRFP